MQVPQYLISRAGSLEWNKLSASLPGTLRHLNKDLREVRRQKETGAPAASISPRPSTGSNNIEVTIFTIIHILNTVYVSSLKKFSHFILVTKLRLFSL